MKITLPLIAIAVLHASLDSGHARESFLDVYPRKTDAAIKSHARAVATLPTHVQRQLVSKRWAPGSTLRIAFQNGSPEIHKKIAEVAKTWGRYANITFDFGYDPSTRRYRSWSPKNSVYVAEIRISLEPGGPWSAIGTESVNSRMFPPNEASMNFEFLGSVLPAMWESTILHEFGHALGFAHEHQLDACRNEIRWKQGPHGEPSIYDVLKKDQGWDPLDVDENMKTIVGAVGDIVSEHDPKSIMHYSLPAKVFIRGKESLCCVDWNETLSAGDIAGAKRAYPRLAAKPRAQLEPRIEIAETAFFQIGPFSGGGQSALKASISALKQQAKPRVFFFTATQDQRQLAQEISDASQAEFAPVQIVTTSPRTFKPDMVEVRYLSHPSDRPVAERMLRLLQDKFRLRNARVSYTERSPKAEKTGDIEVWFSEKILRD